MNPILKIGILSHAEYRQRMLAMLYHARKISFAAPLREDIQTARSLRKP